MGNALGNMKTPSEISFSNTILRTYINFSDPPLKSIKKHQSSSKNSSKLEASTSVKNFSDLSSDDRREINSYLKNVISQIAKSALEDREDEVDTGDDEYLTSKKMKKRKKSTFTPINSPSAPTKKKILPTNATTKSSGKMTRVKRKLEVLQEEEIDFESYKQPPSKKPST